MLWCGSVTECLQLLHCSVAAGTVELDSSYQFELRVNKWHFLGGGEDFETSWSI